LKAMLKGNMIKNCPLTAADVDITEKILAHNFRETMQ